MLDKIMHEFDAVSLPQAAQITYLGCFESANSGET